MIDYTNIGARIQAGKSPESLYAVGVQFTASEVLRYILRLTGAEPVDLSARSPVQYLE